MHTRHCDCPGSATRAKSAPLCQAEIKFSDVQSDASAPYRQAWIRGRIQPEIASMKYHMAEHHRHDLGCTTAAYNTKRLDVPQLKVDVFHHIGPSQNVRLARQGLASHAEERRCSTHDTGATARMGRWPLHSPKQGHGGWLLF